MSLLLNTVGAIQLCAGCAVEFESVVTLGATEDPMGPATFAEVLDVGDRGYLVSSEVLGGVVIVYDSEGRYQRELTREGEGPGELSEEPRFAGGPGGIILMEPGSARLHLYTRDLEFVRTLQVPGATYLGSVKPNPATGGWLVSYRGDDGMGILLLDQEGNVVRSMQTGEEIGRGLAHVIPGTDGMIWTSSVFGRVQLLDEDLELLGSLQLELPGMEAWEESARDTGGYPAWVTDIRLAPDGSGLWVFAMGPEERFVELSLDEFRDVLSARTSALERVVDAYLYWVRLEPDGLTLVGKDHFDTMVRPLGDGDLAYDLLETPDGNRRVRVGRLRFTRTGPDTPDFPTCDHWGSIDFFRDATPQQVRECLQAGADPSGPPGVYPLPPLFVAAGWSPHPAVISVLVDAGADVAAREWGDLTPLHEAADQNTNAGVTAALLEVGADPNARDRDGIAPLHLAATHNSNPDVVTLLIEAGGNPNAREPYGNTPLHLAWTELFFDRRPVMRELLRLGTDPLARNDAGVIAEQTHCDNWSTGYFAYSALPADYARCLDAGADPNARDGEGQTLLHRALENRNPEVAALLLNAGADPNAVDWLGNPPLIQPISLNPRRYKNPDPEIASELVRLLLAAGADPNPPPRGESPLSAAVRSGHTEVIRLLEAAGAEADTRTADGSIRERARPAGETLPDDPDYPCGDRSFLEFAPPESLRACLEAGARFDEPVWFDLTPLAFLAEEGGAAVPAKIDLLLAAGADPNAVDGYGQTTLHRLVGRRSREDAIGRIAVPALLDAGADVNARDDRGRTPLHDAVEAAAWTSGPERDASFVVRLLLRAGTEVNARTLLGESPLHMAAPTSRNPGAPTPRRNETVIGPVISALIEAGAEIDARTEDGRTPLHAAIQTDQPAVVAALLEAGADPALRDDAGNLADPTTCEHWGKAVFFATADADAVARCLEAGADPISPVRADAQRRASLLHFASAHARDPEVITALVEAGANVNARDVWGFTPLHSAAENAMPSAVQALVQAGAAVNAPLRAFGRRLDSRGGRTPLHIAASNPNPEVAAALIEAGADVGARAGIWTGTPLHIAARNPNPAVAALLLDAGANVNAREFARTSSPYGLTVSSVDVTTRRLGGITPLHGAAWLNPNPEVLALLLEAGADPGALAWRTEDHHYAERRSDTHYQWSGNVTPLYDAARFSADPEFVAALVAAGADVNGRGAQLTFHPRQRTTSPDPHLSPLYLAVRADGHPATIEALVRAGADLELAGPDGRTSLHEAAIGYPAVFPLLLRLGADPEARDAEGKTPMDYARENDMLQPW